MKQQISLFRGVRDFLAPYFAECVSCGSLLSFFLVTAPGGRETVATDLCRNLETLAVIGAFFIQQLIGRRLAVLALCQLLQDGFKVSHRLPAGSSFDLRADK